MNKTIKIALCISLVGVCVFVWMHSVASAAPKPRPTSVVNFISGDVIAAPQVLTLSPGRGYIGPFTATIDFAKRIGAHGATQTQAWTDVLNLLQARNPITYESLEIDVSKGGPLYSRLDFSVNIDGVTYLVTMNAFTQSAPTESTPTLDIYHWYTGRFAIQKNGKLVGVGGDTTGSANVDFSMTK